MTLFKPTLITLALALCASCETMHYAPSSAPAPSNPAPKPAMTAPAVKAPAPVAPTPTPAMVLPTFRINAGSTVASKDSAGNDWLPDTGFEGGDVVDRGAGVTIAGTQEQGIFRTEHYSMTGFTQKLPNGKYLVKLYFAETYTAEVSGPGLRVFTINVEGTELKNFDVWAKAGDGLKAYIETVPVEVKDGQLDITFTAVAQNAEINGIEIIPQK